MIYFIVNPIAGTGKAEKTIPFIEKRMAEEKREYRILITKYPLEAAELTKEAVLKGATAVVAVGGDGTIQEVVHGLISSGKKIPLGVIPAGSGNDFAANVASGLKRPKKIEDLVNTYLDIILNCKPQFIDAIEMNGKCFINIGSTGIDAEVADYASCLKKNWGGFSYVVAALIKTITYKTTQMRITYDDGEKTGEFDGDHVLVAISNGKFYGGGFKIAPTAEINDGYITLCAIRKLSRFKLITLFPLVIFAGHAKFREVTFINCKKVSIFYEGVRSVNLDGNIYPLKSSLHFQVLENAVALFRK